MLSPRRYQPGSPRERPCRPEAPLSCDLARKLACQRLAMPPMPIGLMRPPILEACPDLAFIFGDCRELLEHTASGFRESHRLWPSTCRGISLAVAADGHAEVRRPPRKNCEARAYLIFRRTSRRSCS